MEIETVKTENLPKNPYKISFWFHASIDHQFFAYPM